MERRRSARGAAQQTNGNNGTSSDEDEGDATEAPSRLQTTQRQSARRKLGADLARLEVLSLKKYKKHFKLGDQGASKEDLLPHVTRHWQNQVVDEDETIVQFALALRKQATQGTTALLSNPDKKLKPKATAVAKGKAAK